MATKIKDLIPTYKPLVKKYLETGDDADRAALVAYGNKEGLNIQEMISFAMGDKITMLLALSEDTLRALASFSAEHFAALAKLADQRVCRPPTDR